MVEAGRHFHQLSTIINQTNDMASTLKLEIVTPEAKIYSEDVEMVTCRASKAKWASTRCTSR